MDKDEIIETLLEDARQNDATDAVVVEVPPELLRDSGATYGDEDGVLVETTVVAGPVEEETEEYVELRMPSRVGEREDFSPEVRERMRPDDLYGFRDGNLDGVRLPKDEVTVYRVQ